MPLLCAKELADFLRISKKKAYQLLATGEIPSFRLSDLPGSEIRFDEAEVQAYIERRVASARAAKKLAR
jgi:excisionase family DNA binding protein